MRRLKTILVCALLALSAEALGANEITEWGGKNRDSHLLSHQK